MKVSYSLFSIALLVPLVAAQKDKPKPDDPDNEFAPIDGWVPPCEGFCCQKEQYVTGDGCGGNEGLVCGQAGQANWSCKCQENGEFTCGDFAAYAPQDSGFDAPDDETSGGINFEKCPDGTSVPVGKACGDTFTFVDKDGKPITPTDTNGNPVTPTAGAKDADSNLELDDVDVGEAAASSIVVVGSSALTALATAALL